MLKLSSILEVVEYLLNIGRVRDACAAGHLWRAGGAILAPHTELIPSLLSSEGAFSGIVDSLVQENFFWGQATSPQIFIVFLGNQYTKTYSSGKEIEGQHLAL